MRKFTLILASMFLTLGAWAQVGYECEVTETMLTSTELNAKTEATYIAIKNLSATNHYYYVGNTGAAPYSKEDFSNDAVFIWEPTGDGTTFYLKKLDGTYMQTTSPKDFGTVDNAAKFTTTNPTSTGSNSTKFNGDGDSQSYINGNDDANLVRFVKGSNWINVQNGTSGTPTYNTGLGGWTIHYVYSVNVEEVSTVNVTYEYMFDGVVKKSVTVEQNVGSAYEAPAIDYVTFEYPDGSVTKETTTVKVTCTQNLPFTVSTDYANATWYYMTIRSNNQEYVARSENAPYTNSKTITAGDNGLWAFKGNVFDGIQVINKGAGDGYTLGCAGTTTGANVSMAEGENTWTIEEGKGGFILGRGGNAYAHDYHDDKLQIWNDAAAATDAGSAFNVFSAEELTNTQKTALQTLIDQASTYEAGTTIGYYTEASVANLVTPLANANTALSSNSLEEVLNATTALQDAINKLELILPEKGKFYRIKSVNSGNYVTAPANTGVQMTLNAEASANNILYWDAEGHLLVYGTGYYINGKNHAIYGYKDTYTVEGSKTGVAGACAIKPGSANYWHDNGANLDVYQNGTHANCNWTIEEVTTLPVAVSAAGYATLYAPVALTIAEGVNAYTATVDGDALTLAPVVGVIPANTGVILEAEANTYNFAVAAEVAAIEGNALVGAYAKSEKNANAKVYTLQKPTGKEVGFYLFNGQDANEKKTYINGFRAWVEVANGEAAPAMFSLGRGEGTTAIDSVELTNDNVVIYDLAGRRVEKMEKGIYIVNGKKVIR